MQCIVQIQIHKIKHICSNYFLPLESMQQLADADCVKCVQMWDFFVTWNRFLDIFLFMNPAKPVSPVTVLVLFNITKGLQVCSLFKWLSNEPVTYTSKATPREEQDSIFRALPVCDETAYKTTQH